MYKHAFVATSLWALGCGGAGPASTAPSGEATDTASPASTGSTPAGPTVSVQGFVHGSDGAPLSAVTACPEVVGSAANAAACTTTGSDGSFTLAAPANEWVAIKFDKPGFVPTVRAVQTDASAMTFPRTENVMLPVAESLTIGGVTADPALGHIAFSVMGASGQDAVPVSVTLGGAATPQPAIYLDSAGSLTTGATSGTQGIFANLSPGLYSLHFAHASATCAPLELYGWPMTAYQSAGEASVVVPVMAGYVTTPVAAACESAQ